MTDNATTKPVLTADGKPWVQKCYVCGKLVDFLKMSWGSEWLRAGDYVRHKKCKPAPLTASKPKSV